MDENQKKPEKAADERQLRLNKRHRGLTILVIALFIVILILVVVMVAFLLLRSPAVSEKIIEEGRKIEVSQEIIDSMVTRDEEGGAVIDVLPDGDPDDTWGIYVYLDGSNLEGGSVNNMSEVVQNIVNLEKEELGEQNKAIIEERTEQFLNEIWEKGSDLPGSLYTVQANLTGKSSSSHDLEEVTDMAGYGSITIEQLTATDLPENVTIVIQTGGSTAWVNPLVNPNRSQRFVYDTAGFREVSDETVQNMGDSQTMADFLAFCEENYPADHRILHIMDHGSGSRGFAYDNIYDDLLSFKEFRDALEAVYTADPENPPFDIIDFDACLMSSVEMAENLYGFSQYMIGTEEVGLGATHEYTKYLETLASNTGIHPEKLGKIIVDGTVDNIAKDAYRFSWFSEPIAVTMSLTNVNEAHDLYLAYSDLCAAVLKDAVADSRALAKMSRAATQNLRFGINDYYTFNQVDLGILASNLLEDYPVESRAVLDALSKACLYRTATLCHVNATGLSVYFPCQIVNQKGFEYFLRYVDEVCENNDIAALYYYTIAGCLNDEFTEYVESKGYGTPETLNVTPLKQLPYNEVTLQEGANFSLHLTEEQQALIQDVSLYLVRQDQDGSLNLGEDRRFSFNENGTITTDFDGTWLAVNGNVLDLDVIDVTADTVRYKTNVYYSILPSSMILLQDRATGQFSILGIYDEFQGKEQEILLTVYPYEIEEGHRLTPIYQKVNLKNNTITEEKGSSSLYSDETVLGMSSLEDGDYYLMIKAYDVRGDEYYSTPVRFTMEKGEVTDPSVAEGVMVVERE